MNAYIVVIFILALCYTFYMGFSDGANAVRFKFYLFLK